MITLKEGNLLYHGSYVSVPHIDLSFCAEGLDFGRGFYLTSSYEQVCSYVQLSVTKAKQFGTIPEGFSVEDGWVSVYKFHPDPNVLIHSFTTSNIEWLHFVAANRKPELFPRLLEKYNSLDIVGGKIADDRTARVLRTYVSGDGLGVPGDQKTDRETIRQLLPNRLKDQFCFRTQEAVDCLEFVRSDRYGDIER